MAQKINKSSVKQTRRFVFSGINRQRAIAISQEGIFLRFQKGARFGNLNTTDEREMPTEHDAAKEMDSSAKVLLNRGFKELDEREYELFIEKQCLSCADDDLRGYPCSSENDDNLSVPLDDCSVSYEDPKGESEEGCSISLGQKAAQVLLANTELKSCKTLEFRLPPEDIIQAIEFLSEKKTSLGIETLVLKTMLPSDKNGPNEQDGDYDSDSSGDESYWTDLPCDCFSAVFPKVKRLILIGGTWCLEGKELNSLEELEAGKIIPSQIRMKKLKKLKYERLLFYANIESDEDGKPLTIAASIANRCPKLQSLVVEDDAEVEILEDVLSSPLIDKITSLRIGSFNDSNLEKIYLLFTRFTESLSHLEKLTIIFASDSLKKSEVERLMAFPIPLNIEFE